MVGYWYIKAISILWIGTILHTWPTLLNGIRHHAPRCAQHLGSYDFSLAQDDGLL